VDEEWVMADGSSGGEMQRMGWQLRGANPMVDEAMQLPAGASWRSERGDSLAQAAALLNAGSRSGSIHCLLGGLFWIKRKGNSGDDLHRTAGPSLR
jgi:hypothetical protein